MDVPTIRSIESAVSFDFDSVSANVLTGEGKSYIVRGFEISVTSGVIGNSPNSLQLLVSNSALLHGTSLTSGTFYNVPTGTAPELLNSTVNPKVVGSFVTGTTNYIGIEFNRAVDPSTSGQVYLWNPATSTEISKNLPLAEVLSYNIIITSTSWAANVLPIATVVVNSGGAVASITDNRPMYLRLGTAGANTPNPFYSYPWNNQAEGRVENPYTSTSSLSPFHGGDKQIQSLKEWMDAMMTSLKEIKGTTYWYGANTGGSILKLRSDVSNLMMTGKGNISHSVSVPGRIDWSDDIYFNFIGSNLSYKILANPASTDITLPDDYVAYINLVRGVTVVPNLIFSAGSPGTATSVGAVSWTNNVQAGDFVKISANDDTHYYKIATINNATTVTFTTALAPADTTDSNGAISQYAWGTYQTDPSPSTNRHIYIAKRNAVPFTEDVLWLLLREDNGGSIAKVYIRGGSGGDLQQGETRQISDETSQEVLAYIGSPSETITTPDYTDASTTGIHEVFTITVPNAAAITSGQYFTAHSVKDSTLQYFWYNKDSANNNPLVPGAVSNPIAITTGMTNLQVAVLTNAALNSSGYFNSHNNLNGTLTVTLSQVGTATDAANFNVGSLSIVVNTQGVGTPNYYLNDGDNLTKGIKTLDQQIGSLMASVNQKQYEEKLTVVASSPSTNQLLAPVSPSTNITIPVNTRNSNIQQTYIVGAGTLEVYLNGQKLFLGDDYNEVGTVGTASTQISNIEQFEDTDVISFEIAGNGVGGIGSTTYTAANLGTYPDVNVFSQIAGTELQFRSLKAGSNITLTQSTNEVLISSSAGGVSLASGNIYTSNYSLLASDDIALVDTTTTSITITLPDASTCPGKIFYVKKIALANTLYIKSVLSQSLDQVDVDMTPYAMTILLDSITITSVGSAWWII